MILVLAALFAGCTEADGQGVDTPQHTDETDAAVTEAETSVPTQDVPPEELPRINLDEIVWADVVYNSTASGYRPGNFGWYIDDVVEY